MRQLIALSAVAVLWAASARAQDADSASTLDEEARSIFEAGRTAYAAGRYPAAYEYFSHAYQLSHRPGLLFNMAQAADRARMDAEALSAYRQFLAARPDAPEHEMIAQRIRDLSSGAPARTPITETSSRAAPPATPAAPGPDLAPWFVVGAGALVAIGGAILLGVGLSDRGAVEGAPRDTVWDSVADQASRAPALMITGDILLAAGAAAAALGVIWAILTPAPARPAVALGIGPFGVSLQGTFAFTN